MSIYGIGKYFTYRNTFTGMKSDESVNAFTKLSEYSNLSATARYRHIQSIHENNDLRNPDILAGALMSPRERRKCFRLNYFSLTRLRRNPYYFYLNARTKFYDQLILDAVSTGIGRILIIGAGFDTRLYRFGGHLAANHVDLAECDQPNAIAIKQKLAKQLPYSGNIRYLSADLNHGDSWNPIIEWLKSKNNVPSLVYLEGVSPYIESSRYLEFLTTLHSVMPENSWLAYDFKKEGLEDNFGVTSEIPSPFRMKIDSDTIKEIHGNLGFKEATLITPSELMQIHTPSWNSDVSPLFHEDAIVKLVR